MLSGARTALRGLGQWGRASATAIRRDGLAGVRESVTTFYTGLWRLYGMARDCGTPIYERDWDLLVVLDACRADLAAELVADYEFLDRGTATSVASCSPVWMDKNFTDEYAAEMAETAYLTGNPYSREHVDAAKFNLLDEVWRYGWDDDRGTLPADVLTDRAIRVGRERDPDRMILHYMQPHHPFVPNPLGGGVDTDLHEVAFTTKDSVWNRLRRGDLDHERVWEAYRANLAYVLDSVAVLLRNVDADRAVITSDHGNALGEHQMYGHPMYAPTTALREVPWCVTRATDTGTYHPDPVAPAETVVRSDTDEQDANSVDANVEQKLEQLGYL